jgi:ABC-type transport system involved in multi-copper enzyme maturation permease subunit
MNEGIIARFRTMAISRTSVLAGHVIGSVLQTIVALVIVSFVAVLIGFRPTTGPVEWLAAAGLLTLIAFGVTWLGVALGMVAGASGARATCRFRCSSCRSSAAVSSRQTRCPTFSVYLPRTSPSPQ